MPLWRRGPRTAARSSAPKCYVQHASQETVLLARANVSGALAWPLVRRRAVGALTLRAAAAVALRGPWRNGGRAGLAGATLAVLQIRLQPDSRHMYNEAQQRRAPLPEP